MSSKAASILASVPGAPDDPFDVNPTAGNGSSGPSTPGRRSRFHVSTTAMAPAFSMLEPSLDLSNPSNQVAAAVASTIDAPSSGSAAENGERNLLANSHGRMRENPLEVIREFASFTAGTGWRSYTDYIGAPVQYPGYSDAVKKRIVESEAVRQKVEQLVERRWKLLGMDRNGEAGLMKKQEMERELFEVADTMADKMVRALSFPATTLC